MIAFRFDIVTCWFCNDEITWYPKQKKNSDLKQQIVATKMLQDT